MTVQRIVDKLSSSSLLELGAPETPCGKMVLLPQQVVKALQFIVV